MVRRATAAVVVFLLVGCAGHMTTSIDPGQRLAAVAATRAGVVTLGCGRSLGCSLQWDAVRQAVLQDSAALHWEDVAARVIAAGYDADISWYYLGQAAQGLGANDAARLYFETAINEAAAGGPASCGGGATDLCNGVVVAATAPVLLSQVPQDAPAKPPPPRRKATKRTPPKPLPEPAAPAAPAPAQTPAPAQQPFVPPVGTSPAAPDSGAPAFVAPVQ